MSICGRASVFLECLPEINRSLGSLAFSQRARRRAWPGRGVQLGVCSDSELAVRGRDRVALVSGHIHNAPDLRASLGDARLVSKAELLNACHERWGADSCDKIIGDFACAVWDGASRSLMLASDSGALWPLFYWHDDKEIIFASEQRGIWCHPHIPKELDEDQMAAWMARLPREPSRSFYKNIHRVPPGHYVIWKNGQVTLHRYWRPENVGPLRLKRDEDYATVLRETLDEAVRCRIGDNDRVGAHLSGGLDSNSVVALAARWLGRSQRPLVAFTAVPREPISGNYPGRLPDESELASQLAKRYANIEHVLVPNIGEPLFDSTARRESMQDWPVLGPIGMLWLDGIERAAVQRKLNVMLTGVLGNMTISYDGLTLLPALARRGKWLKLARTLGQMRVATGRGWQGMLGAAFGPLLPPSTAHFLRRVVGAPQAALEEFSLVNPDFLKSSGLEARARRLKGTLINLPGVADGRLLRLAVLDRSDHRGHTAAASRRLFGIDSRDPTSDRRVVELCLSIPDEQFLYRGQPRSLIRRAMTGLLPDGILNETRRGQQHADWFSAVDAARADFVAEVARLEASPMAQKCLDVPRLKRLIEDWPASGGDDLYMRYQFALPFAISAGRFIRRIEGGNA